MKIRKISEWVHDVHQTAIEKGWFEEERQRLELHMLMITEISEATEEIRKHKPSFYLLDGKPEGEAIELVDVVLRIFDYAGYKKIDLIHYLKKEANSYKSNYLSNKIPLGATTCPIIRDSEKDREEGFRNTIKAAMCSDPDILMIGEARDTSLIESKFTSISALSVLGIVERLMLEDQEMIENEDIDFEQLNEITNWFSVACHNEKWFKNYENFVSALEKHMLFTITISKASEAAMINDFEEESLYLTRALIQILVYFKDNNWDINEVLDTKHSFNMARAYKHGGKKC